MSHIRILAIDSSSGPASAAVVEDGKILGEAFLNTGLTHSQTLMPMVQTVLERTGTRSPDLIAVCVGPGSFTGVRIGVASAKGLAFSKNLPCVGISSLELLAYNYLGSPMECTVLAMIDARNNQAYRAFFSLKNGLISRITEDKCLGVDGIYKEAQTLNRPLLILGDCAEKYASVFKDIEPWLAPENCRYQMASSAAFAAIEKRWGTAANLQPIYLQMPQAQRELNKRLGAVGKD